MTKPAKLSDNSGLKLRLFWSPRSPFVRYAMIAIHELGLEDQVETIQTLVTAADPVPSLEPYNPVGRIPTLVLPDGTVVHDSRVIVEYLDAHFGDNQLMPLDYPRRLDVLRRVSTGQALIEKGVRWLVERFKPEEQQNPLLMDGLARSITLSLNALEAEVSEWRDLPIDAGHIATANFLGYLDFRYAALKWQEERPNLAQWHDTFKQRPSYVNTEFVDNSGFAITDVKMSGHERD